MTRFKTLAFTFAFAATLALTAALPAAAGSGSDALFRTGVVESLGAGQELAYSQTRRGPAVDGFKPLDGVTLRLIAQPIAKGATEPSLKMVVEQGTARREMAEFPASGGNPVLMVFLEDVTRSMAAIAGGSPFYIRNRLKEALARAEATDLGDGVTEVSLTPFADDPNAARMGDFAGLKLSIRMDPARPGYFESLRATTTRAGFFEEIVAEAGQ